MSPKLKKYSVLIIAAVLLVAMAFAGAASAATHEVKTAEELEDWIKNSASDDVIKFLKSFQMHTTIVLPNAKALTLDLNGQTLTAANGQRLFTVGDSSDGHCTFTLEDSSAEKTGKLTGGRSSGNGGGIYVAPTGTLIVNNGSITDCVAEGGNGGGVFVEASDTDAGTFIFNNGSISGCNAETTGGGVYVNQSPSHQKGGTFLMNGGRIIECTFGSQGSSSYIAKDGQGSIIVNRSLFDTAGIDTTKFHGGITLPANNASLNNDSSTWMQFNATTPYKLYPCPFSAPDGKFFAGWADSVENKTKGIVNYADEAVISEGGHHDLYAVWETVTYPIYITNATGTYQLTSAMKKVYGDYGNSDNGTAELSFDSESKPVLALNGFKASNMSNVPLINSSVADLTIKLTGGESNLTGSYANNNGGLILSHGNLTIERYDDVSKLLVNNTNSSVNAVNSILVEQDLMIDNAKVTAIANGGLGSASGISSSNNIIITGSKTVVDVNATSVTGGACSIKSNQDINIDSSAKVTAKAQGFAITYALYSDGGNVSIGSSAVVEANATSTFETAYSIYALQDLEIASATKVNATAETQGSSQYAYGLYADSGNITITNSPDVTATTIALASGSRATSMRAAWDIDILLSTAVVHSDANGDSLGIYAESGKLTISDSDITAVANSTDGEAYTLETIDSNADITISDSKVNLCANSPGNIAVGISTSYDSKANITISSSSEVTSIANSSNTAYAMFSGGDITIDGIKSLTAIGNTSSFSYQNELDMSSLSSSSTYSFSNASVSGAEPKLYTTFVNPNNWHIDPILVGIYVSNYTSVKIEKKPTPTPSSGSSSSRHTGYTQILQEVPTTTPTLAPTAAPTPATPSAPSASSGQAAQPTQSSPAPVAGIIAGLGAAALIINRLRK